MNTIIIILYILVVILCIVTNALQAAALKSIEECREIDNELITAQDELIEKQKEYIKLLEEEAQE